MATTSLSKSGRATSGVKEYEYYLSRASTVPTSDTIPTGTTNGNVNITTSGVYYIWYRTVSNNNAKSNWSNYQLVKVDSRLYENSLSGSFSHNGFYSDLHLGNFIEIDTSKTYRQTMTAKSNNTEARYYLGFVSYDIDYQPIKIDYIVYISGSTTMLTENLNPGDRVIHLTSTQGFQNGTRAFELGLIIWNYKDSTGYIYPKETYSRNLYIGLFTNEGIDKVNNTITLANPNGWQGEMISAGTYVSQSYSGNTYNYGLLSNRSLSTEYQTFTNTITGITYDGIDKTKFWPGTKYVKPLILHNYNNVSADTTITVSSYTFEEIK